MKALTVMWFYFTAQLRAGIPTERFTVSWEVGGPALCRRTDFRLLDAHGSEGKMRQKAEDLMKRIFSEQLKEQEQRENCQENHEDVPHPESMLGPTDPTEAKQSLAETTTSTSQRQARQSSAGCCNASPPTVSLEVSGQQVRLVFKKVG
eukprot:Skav221737  [mRNA]  locus=scaffold542:480654:484039:- [translate_table: standard]